LASKFKAQLKVRSAVNLRVSLGMAINSSRVAHYVIVGDNKIEGSDKP